MRLIITYSIIMASFFSVGQQKLLPLNSFYKDQLFANKTNPIINNGSFLPVSESDYDLIEAINDSSKQYYDFTEILFKKHLFEIAGEDFHINISPVFDFTLGRDLSDSIKRNLFQNTRGILIEGDLFKNFSFSTSFYENQGRYARYETDFYEGAGELYANAAGTGYYSDNAVIPGATRTKPFKTDGFDYGFAFGYLCYRPLKSLRITAGNNQQFIGDGHRSLLHSDNTSNAPYFRIDWNISSKFKFTYNRSRLVNLMRRMASSSAERYYETKGYSINYITYMPTKKINISLFEGSMWNRGDSVISRNSHPMYYNPIPLISSLIVKNKNEFSSVVGLNLGVAITNNHRAYGQLAMHDLDVEHLAFQIGYRGYRFFGINDLMIQTEFNSIPSGFYSNSNPRLNYTHYNLPLAHPKGQSLSEILVRANYEKKRTYINQSFSYFMTKDYAPNDLISTYDEPSRTTGNVTYSRTEVGYRFNRKVNLTIFGALTYRIDDQQNDLTTKMIQVGFKTGLLNHYKDF